MPTLVTGATGFVGSAVVRQLLAARHDVRVLVRETSDRSNLASLSVDVAIGDLRDRASLQRAASGCSVLFHVAADYRLWVRDPATLYDSNVDGSRNMLLAAAEAGISRMVYTSSVATLGTLADGSSADEQTCVSEADMIGHYKRSKFIAERTVRELIRDQGVPAVIVNPSTPVGPGDIKPTPTGRLIAEAAGGRIPAFVDTGLNIVHVDDVAAGHLLALDVGRVGERYILGGENMSLEQILRAVASAAGRPPPRFKLPHAAVMPIAWLAESWARLSGSDREPMATVDGVRMSRKRMYFSSQKAREQLGYAPRPALDAITDAVRWFRRQYDG